MATIIKLLLVFTVSALSFVNNIANIIFITFILFVVLIKRYSIKDFIKGYLFILMYLAFFIMYELVSVFIFKKEFSLYFIPIILRMAVSYSAVFLFYKTTPSYIIASDLKFPSIVLTLMFIPEIFNIYNNLKLTYKNRYKKKNGIMFIKTVLPLVVIISMKKTKEKYYCYISRENLYKKAV